MNLKEITWNTHRQFLFASWINLSVSTEHYKETAKPCKYNLKNIEKYEN